MDELEAVNLIVAVCAHPTPFHPNMIGMWIKTTTMHWRTSTLMTELWLMAAYGLFITSLLYKSRASLKHDCSPYNPDLNLYSQGTLPNTSLVSHSVILT